MNDLISGQQAIGAISKILSERCGGNTVWWKPVAEAVVNNLPSAQPERPKDIIQNFHDYQVEWLKSHCDIELEPELEMLIVRFLERYCKLLHNGN